MNQAEEKDRFQLNWKFFIFNLLGFISIFSFLCLLRAPLLVNADYLLNFDEAYQGSQIIDLLNGGPVHFYYEGVSYAGIFLGLAAAPFFWLFGINAFAYKIPALIAYALYIFSSFWIVKKIHSPAAFTAVFLMVFSPLTALFISINNWQHNLILFLGNIIFLLFFHLKQTVKPKGSTVFLLGAVIGFSIYSYTFSILYIATIGFLFILTHDNWALIREKISFKIFTNWWASQKSLRMKLGRIIDFIIICFFGAILFSYVFGGFGIDIAGYSIFQINNLHKPVIQVLVIISIRLCFFRDDFNGRLAIKNKYAAFRKNVPGRLILFGIWGFLLGILPRILSILTGEIARGGQGFDVDFNPIKLVIHLWELVFYFIPNFFDIRQPLSALFSSELSFWVLIRAGLACVVALLIVISAVNYFRFQKIQIKKIVKLKSPEFFPELVYIVFPILLCSAVILIQNGTLIRYLLPLQGIICIWVAIYLNKISCYSKIKFAILLLVWSGFYLLNTYFHYAGKIGGPANSNNVMLRGLSIVKLENYSTGLVDYCLKKNILHVYSDMVLAAQINFMSKGKIISGVYDKDKRVRRKNQVLSSKKYFSIIISTKKEKHLKIYLEYLDKNSIKFSKELVDDQFWVLTNFAGNLGAINLLRHLIAIDL
ncbi:glycosyltransferase family 39 protein [Nitrospinae bacterium]|nr:glycosyltransferase family 39 protein [Nitrospinota bacterium]